MQSFWDAYKGGVSENPSQSCGDFILVDKFSNYSYQFSSVIDDIKQGINLVIRGEDLFSSTSRQVYLQKALGFSRPILYLHHPLLYTKESKEVKLSKRLNSQSLKDLREKYTREELLGLAAQKNWFN